MPNIRLKRYTGATWEEVEVQTDWSQILNKPSTFTPTSHTHGAINNNGTIGTTANQGLVTTTGGVITTRQISDNVSSSALSTASTNLVTERDVAYGLVAVNNASQTRATTIYAPTSGGSAWQTLRAVGSTSTPVWEDHATLVGSAAVGQNTYASIAFTSGMRDFEIQCQQDSTTSSYTIARFMLTMDSTYSLSTSVRYFRTTWFNGSVAQTITFQYYYSGTTLYLRHDFNFTIGYRVFALLQEKQNEGIFQNK